MATELFPVGEFLAEELAARGCSAGEFVRFTRPPMELVSGIVSGEGELTGQIASRIGDLHDDYLAWKGVQSAN